MACKQTGLPRPDRPVRCWPRKIVLLLSVMAFPVLAGACSASADGPGALSHTTSATPTLMAGADQKLPPDARTTPLTPAPVTTVPEPVTTVPAPVSEASAVAATATVGRQPPPPAVTVPSATEACAVALAYLNAHAAPGFAHFCRPGPFQTALGRSFAYTCVPGKTFTCPDGTAEIIIADPACAASYENEASNSFWDFSRAGVIAPGVVQNGRTWDPFGTCPTT